MGFDNECILNIQSLAGEYFCPVCRLLVYPNEALQSQCTHLYCKPCLTYVVSTTQACPYDGYLVTEADAKPLTESNKALAETIGKIPVHCLFHRSGCTWQGPLSECTPHCSGCAFGNSPVVCNRCGVQIVHRQVQEHGQTCPGVQPAQQAQSALDTSASGTSAATADQTQAAIQTGITTSQALVSQTTTAPGSDPNQKANSSSQSQAAVPSADQWYQQQQQYQQYYQQYPGYDPYQQQYQNYYPYQQPAVPQSQQAQPPYGTVQNQPQTYLQPQPQTQLSLQPQISQAQAQPRPQIQPPNVQAPIAAQTQNQVQANQQQQVHPTVQTYPAAHGQQQPYYQAPPHSQPHPQQVQVPPYQQPHIQQHTQAQLHPQHHSHSQSQPQPQAQAQNQPQLHPSQPMNAAVQPQAHPSSHAVSGNNSYPPPHLYQPVQSGAPQQHTMHVQSQGMPHSQLQTHVQVQGQFPQQPPLVRPPSSLTTIPNQQQPALLPSPGQVQNIKPAQQQPVPSHAQQPGNLVYQRPLMQAIQQPMLQQYFHHQPYVQQQPSTQLRSQGQSHSFPQQNHASTQSQQNITLSQGIQHTQSNLVGRPMMPSHAVQPQPYAQTAGQVRPMHPSVNHPSTDQNNMVRTNNPVQSGANSRPTMSERQTEKESESSNQKVANGDELKSVKSEMVMKSADDEHKPSGEDKPNQGDTSSKEIRESRGLLGADPDFHALENGELLGNPTLKEEGVDSTMEHSSNGKLGEAVAEGAKEILLEEAQLREEQGRRLQKDEGLQAVSTSAPTRQVQAGGSAQPSHPVPIHHGPTILPQRPGAPPPGPPHHTQGPGHPWTHLRPQGPAHVPGHPFHPSEHLQPPSANPGFGPSSGRGRGHYGPQGVLPPSHRGAPRMQGEPVGGPPFGGMMARAAPYGPESPRGHQRPAFQIDQGAIGQPSGVPPNMLRMNGTPGLDPSSTHGLRDERFKAFQDERLNPFPVDPTFRGIDRVDFEDDLKRFPRPSYLDSDPVSKFGNYSSRPFDRGPHGPKYDIGLNTDPAAGDIGRMEPSCSHPDFDGRRLMDGLAPRSPVRDYPGIPSHGFRGFGPDDFDRREFHRFGDPHGNSFREGRLSHFPGHFRRGEFEGPGNMRTVDGHPGHLRRADHLGPQNLHSHLHLRESMGFGDRHSRLGDMTGPGNFESFRCNRPSHPRLGEPGFRSSFSLQRFPTDGAYTGDLESFDHSRKRKPASMGWCRICKVDCETVEGLDLHSQTREHQKMAMEMVRSIKQNAKKKKLTSGDQSLVEDANKSKSPALKAEEKSIDG